MTQELFNSLMAALHHPFLTGDETDYDTIRSLSEMYPELYRVWFAILTNKSI